MAPELNLPLVNAEDLFLNCCAFYCDLTRTVALVPRSEYVYNFGIGVSGNGISTIENLLYEYQIYKEKALYLARIHKAGEKPIYLCHRETLRFLDCLIQDYILRGDNKSMVCNKICEWWSYEFIQTAKAYFVEYMKSNELDEEMKVFSTEYNPEQYYNYCLSRMGNIRVKRLKFNCKRTIKSCLRFIDRLK